MKEQKSYMGLLITRYKMQNLKKVTSTILRSLRIFLRGLLLIRKNSLDQSSACSNSKMTRKLSILLTITFMDLLDLYSVEILRKLRKEHCILRVDRSLLMKYHLVTL